VSGKTTLLRLAAGLEAPDEGVVRLDGRQLPVVADLDPRIAMVANVPLPPELEHFSVRELVAAPLLSQGCSPREARRRADETLGGMGVRRLARAPWAELSDAERSLVRVSMVICRRPCVVLADDSMRGLSLAQISVAADALRRSARDGGAAVVMTASDSTEAPGADRILMLSAGTIVDRNAAVGEHSSLGHPPCEQRLRGRAVDG
jgi:ABC-type cobalamin/Fe3+-siderophores transport system ATPase subunit